MTEADQLTGRFRAANANLGIAAVTQAQQFWRLIDPDDLEPSIELWAQAITPILTEQRTASAVLAARFYRQLRRIELDDAESFTPVAFRRLNPEQLVASMRAEILPRRTTLQLARDQALTVVQRTTLNAGRSTIIRSTIEDPRAEGVARATSGSPCSFCAMLASRGPVYQADSFRRFQVHGRCRCTPRTVFRREWPEQNQRFAEQWREATTGAANPTEARIQFRRQLEGRTATSNN